MRVEFSGTPATQIERPKVREVRAERTPTSPEEMRQAIAYAYHAETGKVASPKTLDVLTAHAAHETGRGAKMFNYNFGGIKGSSTRGMSAKYLTHEVIDSKSHKMVDSFRAYASLAEGAMDYMHLLKTRYSSALAEAENGDVDGFATELKRKGYYTASVEDYSAALRGLAREGSNLREAPDAKYSDGQVRLGSLYPNSVSGAAPLSSVEIMRVLNAISTLGAQRISRPTDLATMPEESLLRANILG